MAKKSSKKSKNLLQIIMDLGTIVLGGVLLGFLALPHVKYEISSGTFSVSRSANYSGFDLLNFEDGSNTGVAVVLLLIVIFVSLMLAVGLVKLACDLKIVKNNTLSKVVGVLTLLSALAVAVLVIVNIFTISNACSSDSFGSLISGGTYAIWATLIVNACVGVGSLVTSLISLKK